MKKLIIILPVIFSQSTPAQYDPQALLVLDAMSAKYKKLEAFKANFSQKLTNKAAGIDEIISGQITVKSNKYVLNVAGQRIFNNGTDIYTYNPEISEVTISSYDPDESEINPGNVYDLHKEGFKYALLSIESNGDRIIDLDPEKRDKGYFKIRMTINAKDELKSFEVFEDTGNRYLYSIESFQSISLPDSYFTFDNSKYPNVELIDFR